MSQTTTLTLTDFLRARIAEDEEANPLRPGPALTWKDGMWKQEQIAHPDRANLEWLAKRLIVQRCAWTLAEDTDDEGRLKGYYDGDAGAALGMDVLRFVALVYGSHPDYREEWTP